MLDTGCKDQLLNFEKQLGTVCVGIECGMQMDEEDGSLKNSKMYKYLQYFCSQVYSYRISVLFSRMSNSQPTNVGSSH